MPYAAALSTALDTLQAVREACDEALMRLNSAPELAFVFFSPHHVEQAAELVTALHGRLAGATIIGTMGESIIGTGREIEDNPALSVWLADFQGRLTIESFHLQLTKTSDGPTLLGWPDALIDTDVSNATMLVLGDPYTFPTAELFLPTINRDYPGLSVLGGMASGAPRPGSTVLMLNGEVVQQGAVGVLLSGPRGWRHIVSQGCRPIGRPLVITEGEENIVFRVGGQTPLEYLRELHPTLSPRDQQLFSRGLHVGLVMSEYRESFGAGDFLIRNVHTIDSNSGAMVVTDHVRVGQTIQFHLRDADTADQELNTLVTQSLAAGPAPAAALVFTCNGRGIRLFGEPHHDAGVIQQQCGSIPTAGFFAAGELGPVTNTNFIHGYTASVIFFTE